MSRVPVLTPNSVYDPLEWELWLEAHDLNINDIYMIEFLEDGRITVHQYATKDGHRFLENPGDTQAATLDPVTVTPKSTIPVWS